jgi:hypothetical protein
LPLTWLVVIAMNGAGPTTRPLSACCFSTTRVTATELARLIALPEIVDPVLECLACELAAGHDGSHVAFTVAAHGGDQWWWVRWAGPLHEVVQIDPCNVLQAGRPHGDCCLLPHRHRGAHSFELNPR